MPARICTPAVSAPVTVASPARRSAAARKAEPPLTDIFEWPDTPIGIVPTLTGMEFFASDGGDHQRRTYLGHEVGNDKNGSIVTTTGTLEDPLGAAAPRDVSTSRNPDRR